MNFTMYVSKGVLVVGPHGTLDSRSTGPLCDALVAAIREGWRHVAVDLSALDTLTRAGIRGLIVGAKLMQAAGGELRLCGGVLRAEPAQHRLLDQREEHAPVCRKRRLDVPDRHPKRPAYPARSEPHGGLAGVV